MFLEQLKNDQQKESFMNLAYQVATADGSFGLPEIEMFTSFASSLIQLPPNPYFLRTIT